MVPPSRPETTKMSHAMGLYLDGIRDGNIDEALAAHTGARYTQHSTGVADGPEGFKAFFTPFLERNPVRDIQVVRAIEDGPFVFLHVFQSLNDGESTWVTADLFETDADDKVIEHWDVIQAYGPANAAGRTMIDGTVEIADLDRTAANKAHVQVFCDAVLLAGEVTRAAEFVSAETFLQHNPNVTDGMNDLTRFAEDRIEAGTAVRYWKIHRLIGQGNFVVTLGRMQSGDSHYCVFDLFRLEGGLIVEHWDVLEKILAPEQWNNQGKF